jgi:hypothetical protein
VAGFCEHGNEPMGSIKNVGYCLTTWVTMSFSKNILHHRVSKLTNIDQLVSIILMCGGVSWDRRIHVTRQQGIRKRNQKKYKVH